MGKGRKSRKRHEADKEKLYYAEWRASLSLVPALAFCYSIGLDENLRAVDADSIIH